MQLLFTGTTGGTPTNPVADVFRYNVQTQTTDTLTAGDAYYRGLRSDGSRVAWLKGNTFNGYELITAPLSNPATMTTLDSPVRDGTTTRDLTPSGALYSVGDGRVLFSENGRLMLSRTDGSQQFLLHDPIREAVHDNDTAFIQTGTLSSPLIYRLQLP